MKQLLAALTLIAMGTGAFCGSADAQTKSTYDEVRSRGKLLAGVRGDYPPVGTIDASGAFIGFGADIARELAKHLGVEVEFVQTTSANRIPLLLNGQIDAEIGPTSPTRARNEVIDFTYTYGWSRALIVVRKDKSKAIKDYSNETTQIGAVQGAVFVDEWKSRNPKAKIKLYQEYPELMVALMQGQVDVALANEFTTLQLMERNDRLKQALELGEPFYQDPIAIGVRQNDSKWRNWINWGLQRLWATGTFQEIYRKHFKVDPPFHIWENDRLQPGVTEVGKDWDKW